MATKTVIEALRDALQEEMQRDERVRVMGEDVGEGGVFRATEGFLAEFGPDRIIDSPLAESLIVGVAIGAALKGMRPVAEIQFADFIHPAMDQIVSEAARMGYRSNGAFSCPMVIRAPSGGGIHGALYHSQNVEALFAHVPGLKVVAPSTPYYAAVGREAAEALAQGVSVEVVDLRTLAPLDKEAILESVRKTGKALIVHEDNLTGGIGGAVGALT